MQPPRSPQPRPRRSTALVAALPAALAVGVATLDMAAGCSTVLGIENVPPEPEGGDQPPADGSAGAALADGSAGAASADGSAGAASEGATGDGGCLVSELNCNGVCVHQTDLHNCGGCGHDCSNLPNVSGGVSCVAGGCVVGGACAPGFAHCAGSADMGCETPVTTPQNCGGCGRQCTTTVARATARCAAGNCTFECDLQYTSCGGACVDVTSDPANCGRCGHSCQGGACTGAPPTCQPVTLTTGPVYIQGLAVSSTSVYWTDTMSGQPLGTVMTMPIDGGTPVTVASGQDSPGPIVADNTNIYWTAESSGYVLSKVLGMGGGIATIASGQRVPANLAIDANNAYWTDYFAPDGGPGGSVMKAPLGGGASPVTLATGQINPWGLGASATDVYWTDYGGTIVMKVPIAGGSAVPVFQGAQPDGGGVGAGGLVVGPSNVYWTEGGATTATGTVMSIPLGGGTPTTLATGQDGVGAIALDATNLYWTNYTGGTIVTMPLAGGVAPTTLAAGQAGPGQIALDATTVYWANYAGGQVMKVAKP